MPMFLASLYGVSALLVLAGVTWLWHVMASSGPGLWLAAGALLLAPALVAACFRDGDADAPAPARRRAWSRWRRLARHGRAAGEGRQASRARVEAPQELVAPVETDGRSL